MVQELNEIASDPDNRHVLQVIDFQAIERIRELLRQIICVGRWRFGVMTRKTINFNAGRCDQQPTRDHMDTGSLLIFKVSSIARMQ